TKMLKPGAFSSTPIFRARKARSWPSNSFTGSASAVVANGIESGSHLQRSFSGGSPAVKVIGSVAIVDFFVGQASQAAEKLSRSCHSERSEESLFVSLLRLKSKRDSSLRSE